jgi:RNA polymerase primary sigma factor
MIYEVEPSMRGYLKALRSKEFNPLTKNEEKKLIKRYKEENDIDARNQLVSSNLRFTCKLVNSYVGNGLTYSELLSEANSGLIESIDKFDISHDVKLFSYSKWWIMQKMQAAIEKKKKLKLSELPEMNKGKSDVVYDGQIKEMADDYGCVDEDYDTTDESGRPTNDEYINSLLSVLSEREVDMINRYFGRGYEKAYTLTDIGAHYGLTKERVRQIVESAMRKVRCMAVLEEDEEDYFD